jgi:SprT protein
VKLHVGDTVLFGPPGKTKAKGIVVRLGPKARIRQLGEAHGQPAGTEWNVPSTPDYIEVISEAVFGGAAGRGSVPVSKGGHFHPPPRRSSRPPPPPARTSAIPAARPGHAPPSGDLASHRETIDFAHALLRQWAIPNYKVVFSNRFTRRMGQCDFRKREIGYSAPLWPRATPEQRRQTTIHEVAHAVTRDRHGDRVAAHGREWKAQMVAMGASPKRTHNVNREGIRRTRSDTIVMLCCGDPFRVTLKKAHALVTRGGRCRGCGERPVFASAEDRHQYEQWARGGFSIRQNSCVCGAHSLECGLVSR